jgi:teichuronic acid biosynthesis glycosyltransferase TuaG
MTTEGRVSVICTVRDEEKHVRDAISSVLAQPVTEIIVVDDGSTDATSGVLREIADADPRVRVVTSPPLGRGAALRRAVRAAHGDFIVNIDADDVIHPEWIRLGATFLAGNPAMAVVAAHAHYISGGEKVQWLQMEGTPEIRDVTARLAFYNPIVHSSAVMRRTVIEAVGGYEVARRFHFDYDLWVRLARAGWRLGVVDAPLVAKRLHAGQKFERRHRLAYLRSSVITQTQAIRAVGGGIGAWASIVGRLGWGLLPHSVRMTVRRHW